MAHARGYVPGTVEGAGDYASPGLSLQARTGDPSLLAGEAGSVSELTSSIQVVLSDNDAGFPGPAFGPEEAMQATVVVTEEHPLIYFSSMIAPSPDWLIIAKSIDMCDRSTGTWRDSIEATDLTTYDAGVAGGLAFAGANASQFRRTPTTQSLR